MEIHEQTEAGYHTGTCPCVLSQTRHSCTIPGKKQLLNQEAEICSLALVYFLFSNHSYTVYLPVHSVSATLICTLCSKEWQLMRNHCLRLFNTWVWLVRRTPCPACLSYSLHYGLPLAKKRGQWQLDLNQVRQKEICKSYKYENLNTVYYNCNLF